MSDAWLIAIGGGIVATVIGGLLIEPVRRFLRAAGRVVLNILASAARFALGILVGAARCGVNALTASVSGWTLLAVVAVVVVLARMTSVPMWILVVAATIVAGVVGWIQRFTAEVEPPLMIPGVVEVAEVFAPPLVLNELEDAIVRRLAQADGASIGIADLSTATRTKRLRVEQALDRLESMRLVAAYRNIMHGPQFGLTASGRDFAIERGYV